MPRFFFGLLVLLPTLIFAQDTICPHPTLRHTLSSTHLQEHRDYWVALPFHYSDTSSYPVIYVLDAEWRFEFIRQLVFDWGANGKLQQAIVVGIPHMDWRNKRGIDLTFSHSRIEYDGAVVDSTWYNASNSGGAQHFYNYLTQELMPHVDSHYSTNGIETLIGHSYGGYFGGYLLSMNHPFEVLHLYDPSMWYSNGEVLERFSQQASNKSVQVHLTYQPIPSFHKEKIEAFIELLEATPTIQLSTQFYPNDTHNGLFIDSFYQGILKTGQ